MRHVVLLGMALLASQAWGQQPNEAADQQVLCTPFVRYARDLLSFVNEQPAPNEGMRRAAVATIECAQSAVRLWSQPRAEAEFSAIKNQFETGTATSIAVEDARIAVAKATYCDAAFAGIARMAQQYDRRFDVGLVSRADAAGIVERVETLIPICGSSG